MLKTPTQLWADIGETAEVIGEVYKGHSEWGNISTDNRGKILYDLGELTKAYRLLKRYHKENE